MQLRLARDELGFLLVHLAGARGELLRRLLAAVRFALELICTRVQLRLERF
jgi:hypothetical protein